MKIAVINFSGNVGKTTITRHLLAPRIPDARVIAIESINAEDGSPDMIRGRDFGQLQEYLPSAGNLIVDIGASNVEDLLATMRRYRGSHAEFDYYVVPTVGTRKQQMDTIATLVELQRIGVPESSLRVVFNLVEDDADFAPQFAGVLTYLDSAALPLVSSACRIGYNEIYTLVGSDRDELDRNHGTDLRQLAADPTDYKRQIAAAPDMATKLKLARSLANHRLASGVVPELDACFMALGLDMSLATAADGLIEIGE